MRREKLEKKTAKKKMNTKTYLRDFLLFVDKYLIKATGILVVVAILLVAISVKPFVSIALASDCVGACRDGVTMLSEYSSKLQVLLVTLVAGIVPYIYAPVIGFIGYTINEVSNLAFVIKGYGYLGGIGLEILPLIINLCVICTVTALGMYICKTVTVGYKISSMKNMNFTNFKIRLYEALGKEDKVASLTKTRDKKIEKLEKKKEKLKYLQILNTSIVVCILQFISVLIQQILL